MYTREKLKLVLALGIPACCCYYYLNSHPIFTPRMLPMTFIDDAIPFLPWTVWPYILLLYGTITLPFCIKNRENYLRMAVTFVVAFSIHVAFWALWPTTYPRPPAPSGDTLTEQAYLLLVTLDSPANCFPSGHITVPGLLLYFITREQPQKAFWIWPTWTILSISILTTKQHYLWDFMGGLLTVYIGVQVSAWWSKRKGWDRFEENQ